MNSVSLSASGASAERGLVGAGIVLGLAKQRLARFIALFASLFVGGRSLRHPHAVPPTLEAALVGGAVRVEQRLLIRPLCGDLLLRLQVLLEEMVVVGGVGLRLPELLLMLLPHRVHVLGTCLADGHGAMHRRGWRGGGGWRRIVDYHVLHWDVVVLRLPAGQPVGSNGCHLLVVRRPPVLKSAGARGSHGGW